MLKKMARISFCILLVMVMVTSAFADRVETYSESKSVTVYKHSYRYYSSIVSLDDAACLGSFTHIHTDDNVPTGYFGGKCRLYNSNGTLIDSNDWSYNSSAYGPGGYKFGNVYFAETEAELGKYCYSKGQARFYNGDGYNTYTCTATANMKLDGPIIHSMTEDNSELYEIKKNEFGEIYGSEVFLNEIGVQPDLILAQGDNGVVGYVRAEDLDKDDVACPEDVLIKQMEASGERIINLYDDDGRTILDTYTVKRGEVIVVE